MNMGQNTKGNDGKGARKKLLRQIGWLCAIIVGWVVLFKVLYWSLGGSSPSIPSSRHRHHEDDRIDGSGTGRGGIKSEGAFFGGSNWRANPGNVGGALKDVTRGLRNGLSQFSNAAKEEAAEFRRNLHLQFRADGQRDEDDVLQDIIDAKLHLVDLKIIDEELEAAPRNSYAGIYGSFCKLNWEMHKRDPSAVPMFRDLVDHSYDCKENQYKMDLRKVIDIVRPYDEDMKLKMENSNEEEQRKTVPKVLNLTAVTFHESRCGSTLVANAMAAMDPAKHRSYSESQPPIIALKNVCGETYGRCSVEQAAKLLQDVMYLMSRSNDPKEERVFFKIQSVGTKNIEVFQLAYPDVPWMFVYRDPVQVIMSYIKDDPKLQKTNCVRTLRQHRPPSDIRHIAKRHGYNDPLQMVPEDYCAAHLAAITESAVNALQTKQNQKKNLGIPVLYDELPGILYEDILPNIVLGRPMTEVEIKNIDTISSTYSKGRGVRHVEFHGDSEQKTQSASEAVKSAAKRFLQESYDQLTEYRQSRVLL